ncbi:hypothetical protein [Neobacillus ginsengisoli]|uniref:Uncharacterized protein n=1 Tax=Neobacillus ginsengisoli TaxID=904295 RepID=A0ABT9XXQ2_9BACI|nr:hypothetical protein [Neobacillus ginsengisoli]MDQ0200350.1 hypothetical protein [Neobacillus ginsengisoli]
MKESKKGTAHIVSNDAIIGKPYLDIDRVILDGKSQSSVQIREDLTSGEKT